MSSDDLPTSSLTFTLNGTIYSMSAEQAGSRIRARTPEPIHQHWVEIDGVRWPVKQAFEAAISVNRAEFTSQTAGFHLGRLGFTTSRSSTTLAVDAPAATPSDAAAVSPAVLSEAFDVLSDFFEKGDFTGQISSLESELAAADASDARAGAERWGFSSDLLLAALTVRARLGRLNDVIHASTISCVIPLILQPGETLSNKPSLAAGNDPTRHFDLETTHRVAEFKVSVWKGADGARQRGLFADLINLTLDDSGRARELYVVGERPAKFLTTSRRLCAGVLEKNSSLRTRRAFDALGNDQMTVADFMSTSDVSVIDLTELLPGVFTP